jgi:hypothetical protein
MPHFEKLQYMIVKIHMKYKKLLVFFFLGIAFFSNAQNMYKHNFTIYTGIANHKIKDETISPMIYRGTAMPIGLELNFKYKHYIHRLYNFV